MNARWMLYTCLLALAGCTASPKDTFWMENIVVPKESEKPKDGVTPGLPGVSVDAKQRFVWAPVRIVDGKNQRIVCAEPSPDALSALSSQFAATAQASVAGKGEGAVAFEKSFAEAAQQLGERTVTIQLLRDNLYRACEAYANGLLDEFGYGLILSAIDDVIIKLVALEVLAEGGAETSDPNAEEKLQKAVEARIELERARAQVANATQRKQSADAAALAAKGAADAAIQAVTGIKTEQTAVNTTIEDEKRKITELENANKDASENKTRLRELENRKIALEGRFASAELEESNAKTASTRRGEEADGAATALNTAEADLRTAETNLEAAEATAASIARTLTASTSRAIVDIVKHDRGPRNLKSACLMWFASQSTRGKAVDSTQGAGKHCTEVLEANGLVRSK